MRLRTLFYRLAFRQSTRRDFLKVSMRSAAFSAFQMHRPNSKSAGSPTLERLDAL